MLQAVIFDVDGVLVDSYRPHFESWRKLAAEHGLTLTEEQFARSFGRTSRDIIRSLWGDPRLDEARIRRLDDRKEALYREIVSRDFPAMDGARELLEVLHGAGIRLAVGSSGPPENVDLVLDRLDGRSWIGAVVNGMDVTRGKPDPQVFRIAADRLDVDPASCAVIEDAPDGIRAALAAGMTAVGLVSTGRSGDELRGAGAHLVVSSLRELSPSVLRAVG
jgi:beta-phosphoglucomutase